MYIVIYTKDYSLIDKPSISEAFDRLVSILCLKRVKNS